jgi:glycosyltransferase involved in cell wall biosynthesis
MIPKDTNKIEISCIVPVHNTAEYIEKCITSILEQLPLSIEIICVDDASSDNSTTIIEKLIERHPNIIRLIKNQTNRGVSFCRNIGIRNARGTYISFIDSDDWIGVGFYSSLLEKMYDTQAQIGASCIHRYDNNLEKVTKIFSKWQLAGIDPNDIFDAKLHWNKLLQMNPSIWDGLFCRSLFLEHNIQFPDLPFAEDLCCFFELFQNANKVCYSEQSIYFYRVKRAGSVVSDRSIDYVSPMIYAMNHVVKLHSKMKQKIEFEKEINKDLGAFVIDKVYAAFRRTQKQHKQSRYEDIKIFFDSLPEDIKLAVENQPSYRFFAGSWKQHRKIVLYNKYRTRLKKIFRT